MDDHDQDLRTLLKAQLEAQGEALDWHPTPEQLEAFQKGDLPAAETRRVRDHLPLCPNCTDFVLALDGLRGLEAGASEEVSPEEMEAAWSDFQEAIHRERAGPRTWHRERLLLLAAVLALAVVGLSLWCWQLYSGNRRRDGNISDLTAALKIERDRSADLSVRFREQSRRLVELDRNLAAALRPRINTPVIDLAPRSFRGEGSGDSIPTIPGDSDLFTLILEPEGRRTFPSYAVDLFDSQGRKLWALEGLIGTEFGNLSLTLARRGLPAGEIRLRLYGIKGGGRVAVGDYTFSVSTR